MSSSNHTYGPTCALSRLVSVSGPTGDDYVPPLKAQFFYSAQLPIDDPLSAVPSPTGSESKSAKYLPRPFSANDNNALEEAWLGLTSEKDRKFHHNPKGKSAKLFAKTKATPAVKESTSKTDGAAVKATGEESGAAPAHTSKLGAPSKRTKSDNILSKTKQEKADSKQADPKHNTGMRQGDAAMDNSPALPRASGIVEDAVSKDTTTVTVTTSSAGTTGFPFKRALSRNAVAKSRDRSSSPSMGGDGPTDDLCQHEADSMEEEESDATIQAGGHCKAHQNTHGYADVPVGVSRLHLVKLPALQMMPIYWSPVHDIAAVTRGTWFYKDTMLPVEPAVANQLEMGYRELRPWSQTWRDELKSAIEVGAAGEEKITHRLWPEDADQKCQPNGLNLITANPYCAARCFQGEVSAAGITDPDHPHMKTPQATEVTKRFSNCHVIYKDSQTAFILKPSLQPSDYYGRRPLAKIQKGITVGIPVARGFDWKAWYQLHPSKRSAKASKAEAAAPVTGTADSAKTTSCEACSKSEERPRVTDLVLVIHGIGQKLSERVESFHFTHAINAFRRSVNVEANNEAVRNVFRKDFGGIMVLPVNWRANLSFEDGGPMTERDKTTTGAVPDFTLKDITPDTIPAVRNLISDVMLDIPFYMSHHKPKMIEALITEANRVYRLWCQNNPEFDATGRVHIIAHSLGSAMALDVLSKQPTAVRSLDLRKMMSTKSFEFDTKNLFFAGSPAGFFLLLEKGKLLPRKARQKPGAAAEDTNDKTLCGDAGQFGCLAVDNLYNVLHYNDPIAYRLNGAVDPIYAATFKNARVPSATAGWLETIGNAMRINKAAAPPALDADVASTTKPSVARLPSQLEMEVHDFSREEIAEKKFYLLNDNGQIDYYLSSGGGPLELQYINMLSAHSSYWISPDFVRMLVLEVGKQPGRSTALPSMRVTKVGQKKTA